MNLVAERVLALDREKGQGLDCYDEGDKEKAFEDPYEKFARILDTCLKNDSG